MHDWWYKRPGQLSQTWGQIVLGAPVMIAVNLFVLGADEITLRIFGGVLLGFKAFDWAASLATVRKRRVMEK